MSAEYFVAGDFKYCQPPIGYSGSDEDNEDNEDYENYKRLVLALAQRGKAYNYTPGYQPLPPNVIFPSQILYHVEHTLPLPGNSVKCGTGNPELLCGYVAAVVRLAGYLTTDRFERRVGQQKVAEMPAERQNAFQDFISAARHCLTQRVQNDSAQKNAYNRAVAAAAEIRKEDIGNMTAACFIEGIREIHRRRDAGVQNPVIGTEAAEAESARQLRLLRRSYECLVEALSTAQHGCASQSEAPVRIVNEAPKEQQPLRRRWLSGLLRGDRIPLTT